MRRIIQHYFYSGRDISACLVYCLGTSLYPDRNIVGREPDTSPKSVRVRGAKSRRDMLSSMAMMARPDGRQFGPAISNVWIAGAPTGAQRLGLANWGPSSGGQSRRPEISVGGSARRPRRPSELQMKQAAYQPKRAQPNSLKELAPRVGFEPTTSRLTAGCSTAELPRNSRYGLECAGHSKCRAPRQGAICLPKHNCVRRHPPADVALIR